MEKEALGLFELNRQIRLRIQSGFPESIWLVAEISDLSVNRNGHCYLELIEKEPDGDKILARSRATIWASAYRMLRPYFESATGQELTAGIEIMVRVDVEFHELYSINLNIRDIEPSFTVGDLARKRRLIIQKLEEAGVFGMNKELEMPLVPQKIAIISSPTAAGFGDFNVQLSKNPFGYIFYTHLFPAVMQGEETVGSIIAALDTIAGYENFFDAVVIIRGGGSKLDLSSFDNFDLGLNVAQFPLPVITGIGHEQDDSIIDLVAHTRCKTPTAVAEFHIGQMADFETRLDESVELTVNTVKSFLADERSTIARIMEGMRLRVKGYTGYRELELNQVLVRAKSSVTQYFRTCRETLSRFEQISALKDPVNLLKMGYSITLKDGKPLKSVREIHEGDQLTTVVADGKVASSVLPAKAFPVIPAKAGTPSLNANPDQRTI
ncbi:MAG: exodeoxyribonuclease VII large subunit [Bacteroidales bacterium]|nr:exodeoxyribonuclease VII large subunit [Bacteroidales bacterium]